jgi:hypothetical protein
VRVCGVRAEGPQSKIAGLGVGAGGCVVGPGVGAVSVGVLFLGGGGRGAHGGPRLRRVLALSGIAGTWLWQGVIGPCVAFRMSAGRVRPGHCLRLCTEEEYEKLPGTTGGRRLRSLAHAPA